MKEIQFCTNENKPVVRQLISKASSQSGCLGLQAHGDPFKDKFWLQRRARKRRKRGRVRVVTPSHVSHKQPSCFCWVADIQHSISTEPTMIQPSSMRKPQSSTTADHFHMQKEWECHILQALNHCCQRRGIQREHFILLMHLLSFCTHTSAY